MIFFDVFGICNSSHSHKFFFHLFWNIGYFLPRVRYYLLWQTWFNQICVLLTSGWINQSSCCPWLTETSAHLHSVAAGWIGLTRANTWLHWRTCVISALLIPILPSATSRAVTRHSMNTLFCSGQHAKRC